MANAAACRKSPSGETRQPPFTHLPWAFGTMGQHLIPQALEGELEEIKLPQGMGQSGMR